LVLIKDKLKWLGETRTGQGGRVTYEIDKFDDWVRKEITLARTYEKNNPGPNKWCYTTNRG
jgi:hypothetical protein